MKSLINLEPWAHNISRDIWFREKFFDENKRYGSIVIFAENYIFYRIEFYAQLEYLVNIYNDKLIEESLDEAKNKIDKFVIRINNLAAFY